MARLSVDVHRIGTSSVTVVGWPARTRVTLMFQVPVAGKVAPRTETWLAVMGTTSSRLGGMSAVPAVSSTASTGSNSPGPVVEKKGWRSVDRKRLGEGKRLAGR